MGYTHPFHITIARQLGSGGSELARRVAGQLNFNYMDRQILQQAAAELDTPEADLAHREERIKSFWIRMLETFSTASSDYMVQPLPPPMVSDEKLFQAESRAMLKLSHQGSCVIVGRCGFHVLSGHGRLLNIFIHAPRSFRIDRLVAYYGVKDKTVAGRKIDIIDQERNRYVEMATRKSWTDARNYHLSMDMSQIGFDAAEATIVSLAARITGNSP